MSELPFEHFTPLDIVLSLREGEWANRADPSVKATVEAVGVLEQATLNGKPGVAILVDLGDRKIVAWTTLALFQAAARAIRGRYGEPV